MDETQTKHPQSKQMGETWNSNKDNMKIQIYSSKLKYHHDNSQLKERF